MIDPHDPLAGYIPSDPQDAKIFDDLVLDLKLKFALDSRGVLNYVPKGDVIELILRHGYTVQALLELARLGGGNTPARLLSESPVEQPQNAG